LLRVLNMAHISKDERASHLEDIDNEKGIESPSLSSQTEHDPKLVSRLRHKIDWRLIPALGAMYGISLMVFLMFPLYV
jgi:hypothetical protein